MFKKGSKDASEPEAKPDRKANKARKPRFVFLLGDDGAILVLLEGKAVSRRLFTPSPESEQTNALIELLATYPKAPVSCLIDMMDQSYVRHTLPPVTGFGLKKIIQRRLDRDFPKEDLKGALVLGREKSGRKDWNVLLISLAYGDLVKKWLDLLLEQPNQLKGVYLLPVEGEYLIDKINKAVFPDSGKKEKKKKKKKKSDDESVTAALAAPAAPAEAKWKMLVSHNKVSGVRQIVLREGKLVFTRLAHAGLDANPQLVAGNIEQEILNTIEYLKRLGFNEAGGLDIFAIVSQEIKENLSAQRMPVRHFKIFTPADAAELLHLEQAALAGDRFGDVVIATLFALQSKHRLKFALPIAAKFETFYMAGIAVRGAGVLLCLGILGYGGYNLYTFLTKGDDVSSLTDKVAAKRKDLTEFKKQLEKLPADIDEINDVVSLHTLLLTNQKDPLDLVPKLASHINANFMFKEFSWKNNQAVKTPEAATLPPLDIAFQIDAVYDGSIWKTYTKKVDAQVDALAKLFPDFTMKRTFLPGQVGESDSLDLSISNDADNKGGAKVGDVSTIEVDFTGPKAEAAGTAGATTGGAAGAPAPSAAVPR